MNKTSFFSFFLSFLIVVLVCLLFIANAKEAKKLINYNSHLLTVFTDKGPGTCTGTAIEKNALLTASHCYQKYQFPILVGGKKVKITHLFYDKTDHLVIVFDKNIFQTYSKINMKTLEQGQDVSFIGNPGILRNMFRKGYVSSIYNDATIFDINSYHGDSGSAIYDEKGDIRCTVSDGYIQISPKSLHMQVVICYPFTFDKKQKNEINLLTKSKIML